MLYGQFDLKNQGVKGASAIILNGIGLERLGYKWLENVLESYQIFTVA